MYFILDSVHQRMDKAFRFAAITFLKVSRSTKRVGSNRFTNSLLGFVSSAVPDLVYGLVPPGRRLKIQIDRYPTQSACTSTQHTGCEAGRDPKMMRNTPKISDAR